MTSWIKFPNNHTANKNFSFRQNIKKSCAKRKNCAPTVKHEKCLVKTVIHVGEKKLYRFFNYLHRDFINSTERNG